MLTEYIPFDVGQGFPMELTPQDNLVGLSKFYLSVHSEKKIFLLPMYAKIGTHRASSLYSQPFPWQSMKPNWLITELSIPNKI